MQLCIGVFQWNPGLSKKERYGYWKHLCEWKDKMNCWGLGFIFNVLMSLGAGLALFEVLKRKKKWREKCETFSVFHFWAYGLSQIVLLHGVLVKQKQRKKLAFAKLIFFLDQHLHTQSRCPDSCVCVWMVEVVFVSMRMIGAVPLLGGFAPFCQNLVLVWTSRGLSYVMFLVFLLRVTPADIVKQNRKAHRHRYSRRELWATRKHVYIYINHN